MYMHTQHTFASFVSLPQARVIDKPRPPVPLKHPGGGAHTRTHAHTWDSIGPPHNTADERECPNGRENTGIIFFSVKGRKGGRRKGGRKGREGGREGGEEGGREGEREEGRDKGCGKRNQKLWGKGGRQDKGVERGREGGG